MQRFATIDIGTNAALLLIAEVSQGKIKILENRAEIPRLGKGLGFNHALSSEGIQQTLAVVTEYADLCKKHAVERLTAVGTEALRRANNAQEFLTRAEHILGASLEVISGEREATLTHRAATHDFGTDILTVDIGGGSTELIVSEKSSISFVSIPTGSVLLTELYLTTDPVTETEYSALEQNIDVMLKQHATLFLKKRWKTLIATAGTATTLAAMHAKLDTYDQERVHGYTLSATDIDELILTLQPLRIQDRKKLVGLHPRRADAILAGATLLRRIMIFLGCNTVTVSDRGLRWGLLYELLDT